MEFGRKGLEVSVLGKTMLGVVERSLGVSFKDNFSGTHGRAFLNEVVLVYCF